MLLGNACASLLPIFLKLSCLIFFILSKCFVYNVMYSEFKPSGRYGSPFLSHSVGSLMVSFDE